MSVRLLGFFWGGGVVGVTIQKVPFCYKSYKELKVDQNTNAYRRIKRGTNENRPTGTHKLKSNIAFSMGFSL